jgi:UDP-N-acetylglucosamine:LPS N-acetylglucosamine transferase
MSMLAELGSRARSIAQGLVRADAAPAAAATDTVAPVVQDVLARGSSGLDDAIRGRRVLVFTMGSGGHASLARSLEQGILERDPNATVRIVDGFAEAGEQASDSWIKRGIAWIHGKELEHTPWTYEAQHRLRYTEPGVRAERAISTALFKGKVQQQIAEFQPDVIVSTHERLTAPLSALRRSDELQVPVVATLFDANPHGAWLGPGVDQHVLYHPSDMHRIGRVFFGSGSDTLHATLARPPVDPRAFASYDVAAVRGSFGLPVNQRVALVSGGSTGIPVPDEDIWRLLRETDFHIAIPTGRNEASLAHLRETFPPDRVTAIPFTTEMPALLSTSDVAVLNANGATSVEAFAAKTPVVVFNPVAGHGHTSAQAIDADRIATYAETTDELVDVLHRVGAGDADIAERVANASRLFEQRQSSADAILGARLAS